MYEGGDGGPDKVTLLHTTCGTPTTLRLKFSLTVAMMVTWQTRGLLVSFYSSSWRDICHLMSQQCSSISKISNADFSYPSWFEDDVKDLLDKNFGADPKKRLSLMEITRHPWLRKEAHCPTKRTRPRWRSWKRSGRRRFGTKESSESNKKALTTPSEADMKAAITTTTHCITAMKKTTPLRSSIPSIWSTHVVVLR